MNMKLFFFTLILGAHLWADRSHDSDEYKLAIACQDVCGCLSQELFSGEKNNIPVDWHVLREHFDKCKAKCSQMSEMKKVLEEAKAKLNEARWMEKPFNARHPLLRTYYEAKVATLNLEHALEKQALIGAKQSEKK